VPGFESTGCQRRRVERGMPADAGAADAAGSARSHEGAMQWTFSDGLATVSLFIEPFDRQRHAQEVTHGSGATQLITRRLAGAPAAPEGASWWLTAVGEVPVATLEAFARGLERRR
jgi:sigma-E factor negative regulatory protein RseB